MKEFHGNFSLGLLDGRIQFEGPIIKNKTSFNVAMRRSGQIFLLLLYFLYLTVLHKDKKNLRYAFHDINGKITHRFSDRNKLSLSIYSGNDLLKVKARQIFEGSIMNADKEHYNSDFKVTGGIDCCIWLGNYQFTSKLSGNFTAVYARNTLCSLCRRWSLF